jgi:hypothetical protein
MSQNEMLKKLMVAGTACVVALAPCISTASLPKTYFPEYRFVTPKSETKSATPIGQARLKLKDLLKISRTPAAINRAALTVSTPSKVFYGENGQALSPDLIMNFNHMRATEKPFNIAEHIPLDMKPSNSTMEVFSQVADRSLSTFFNSPSVRESSLGKAATTVEQKMNQEVAFGGTDPKSIQHRLNFNVQAFQALAQVQYTGLTNAALKYKLTENKMALEVFEKVATNQDFVMSHTMSSSDQVSEVSFRWSF